MILRSEPIEASPARPNPSLIKLIVRAHLFKTKAFEAAEFGVGASKHAAALQTSATSNASTDESRPDANERASLDG